MMMRPILCFLLVLFLHIILSLDGVSTTRYLHHPHHHAFFAGTTPNTKTMEIVTQTPHQGMKRGLELVEGLGAKGEMKKIGSSPPSCEHRCYGCMPCEAIQVPTTTSHVGVQYTNYEPEGWRCKCGPAFYSP